MMNNNFSPFFSAYLTQATAYADIVKLFSNKIENQDNLSPKELSTTKIDAFVNSGVKGEVVDTNIRLWKEKVEDSDKIDPKNTDIYKILNNQPPKNDVIGAVRYSAANAIFGSEKKGTFMEQFLDMSNEERLKIIKFYDENSIDFGIPGIEEKASALFLEAISLDEWKNRVKELSSQSPVKNTLQYIKNEFQQNAKNSALSKRNNPMPIQEYSKEKSKNMSVKNEILKAFFEEFLKNQNPLALLEIMKKTDIRA